MPTFAAPLTVHHSPDQERASYSLVANGPIAYGDELSHLEKLASIVNAWDIHHDVLACMKCPHCNAEAYSKSDEMNMPYTTFTRTISYKCGRESRFQYALEDSKVTRICAVERAKSKKPTPQRIAGILRSAIIQDYCAARGIEYIELPPTGVSEEDFFGLPSIDQIKVDPDETPEKMY